MSLGRAFHRSLFNRQHLPLLAGICVGIVLSLMTAPVANDGCRKDNSIAADPGWGGQVIERGVLQPPAGAPAIVVKAGTQKVEEDYSDYEPRINLAGKPQSAKKEPQALIRPRYFSTELGIKEKCFVAILSSLKQIPTLGLAINKTIAHHFNRLAFFVDVSSNEKLDIKTLPIVGFRDSQQGFLSLHTLKYLADKLLEGYSYFFLMKDTSFVNGRKLAKFVNHISITDHVYMGSPVNDPGFGPSVCSIDSGIIISGSVLSALAPILESCTEEFAFNSDDEKVGLCIHKALNLTCQTELQGQRFSSFHLDEQRISSVQDLEEAWNSNIDLQNTLTAYPSRDPTHFYMLNKLSCATALGEADKAIAQLEKSIHHLAPRTPAGTDSVTWPVGLPPQAKPDNRFDVIRWEYFNTTHIFLTSEQSIVEPLTGVFLEDIQEVIDTAVTRALHLNPGYKFVKLINGYKRFDPTRGIDYLLDLLMETDRVDEKQTTIRMEACRPITHVETVPMPYVTESSRVNILLPVFEAKDTASVVKFVRDFSHNLLGKSEDVHLTVMLFYPPSSLTEAQTDVYSAVKESVTQITRSQTKKDEIKIHLTSYKLQENSSRLSDTRPLDMISVDLLSSMKRFVPESLIFLCYPHSEIHSDFLNRVRINTISGWQLYSPIPFAEYNPDVTQPGAKVKAEELNVSTSQGFYDTHDTWHISFYMADYLNARKSFELELPVVRSEKDLQGLHQSPYPSILAMFARIRRLHILRAVEPQLRLRYRSRHCKTETCQESHILSQGTRSQLVKFLFDQEPQKLTRS